jgi:hypothetical protein
MVDVMRAAIFFGFIALGWSVSLRSSARWQKRAVSLLAGYALGGSLMIAITQHDAWPFSPFVLYGYVPSTTYPITLVQVRLLDDAGRERAMHDLTVAPMPMVVTQIWLQYGFLPLSERDRDAAAAYLINRAEADRLQVCRGGRRLGESVLGPLTAPPALLWRAFERPEDDCHHRFTGLRVYRWQCIPAERFRDRSRFDLLLLYEYRR